MPAHPLPPCCLSHLRLQLPLPVEAKPKPGGGGESGAAAPRKRGPRPSRKEAEENAVRRVSRGVGRGMPLRHACSVVDRAGVRSVCGRGICGRTGRPGRPSRWAMPDASHGLPAMGRAQPVLHSTSPSPPVCASHPADADAIRLSAPPVALPSRCWTALCGRWRWTRCGPSGWSRRRGSRLRSRRSVTASVQTRSGEAVLCAWLSVLLLRHMAETEGSRMLQQGLPARGGRQGAPPPAFHCAPTRPASAPPSSAQPFQRPSPPQHA